MSFYVAGWRIALDQGPGGDDYWRAYRGPWQRGAYSPAILRECCEITPLHLAPIITEDTMSDDYERFLAAKHERAQARGFAVDRAALHPRPFPFQRDLIEWHLTQGCSAAFVETGLGKTTIEVEWAKHVAAYTRRPALIVAPLAVTHQTAAEAALLDVELPYVADQGEADAAVRRGHQLVITNYDRLAGFDGSAWGGVALDESSILKPYTGKTKQRLLAMFRETPFKLAATATPAPNDHIELGNHSEFLGVKPSHEMLAEWFTNNTMKAGKYRLRHHAEDAFWGWVTSWAACVSAPSDLGYSDEGYVLPPLDVQQHIVDIDYAQLMKQGSFYPSEKLSATTLWRDKGQTLEARCRLAAELVATKPHEPWLIWCDTDAEADRLLALIRGVLPRDATVVELRGSESAAAKERKLVAFSTGQAQVLITKPEIAGFGLNWQHCSNMVFAGVTFSFEKFYQALRRCWRFGQRRPVTAHVIVAETEGNVQAAIAQKQTQHREMQRKMTAAQRAHGLLGGRGEGLRVYTPTVPMSIPSWLHTRKAA